jgi:hypothetical protein
MFEFDLGNYTRASGTTTNALAAYHELSWLAGNGANLLIEYDWEDPDVDVHDDETHRLALGMQIAPVPGWFSPIHRSSTPVGCAPPFTPQKHLYVPISLSSTATGGSSHRSLISFWNALNASVSLRGFPPAVSIEARCTKLTPSSSENEA